MNLKNCEFLLKQCILLCQQTHKTVDNTFRLSRGYRLSSYTQQSTLRLRVFRKDTISGFYVSPVVQIFSCVWWETNVPLDSLLSQQHFCQKNFPNRLVNIEATGSNISVVFWGGGSKVAQCRPIIMLEDRDKWINTSMVWPTLESRTAKEQNRWIARRVAPLQTAWSELEMSDGRQAVPVRRAQLGYHHDADGSPPLNDATKTVTLYANGNEHFHGRPVVVSRRRTRTWDSFLAQATQACIHCAWARDVLYSK